MLHAILLFSLVVTALCCYTLHLITKERETLNHHRYTTLYNTDIKALQKPLRVATSASPFKRSYKSGSFKSVRKRPIIEIIENVDNFYPIAPKTMHLDVRV